jgi:hypothetical protein
MFSVIRIMTTITPTNETMKKASAILSRIRSFLLSFVLMDENEKVHDNASMIATTEVSSSILLLFE